jgi:hypothetical protein
MASALCILLDSCEESKACGCLVHAGAAASGSGEGVSMAATVAFETGRDLVGWQQQWAFEFERVPPFLYLATKRL